MVLDVPDPSNFRVLFKILKDGQEPELGESQHKCILMGIVPRRASTEAFVVDEDHPRHGFFITDYGNLWGQDGTDSSSEIHNLPIGTTLSLQYISEPAPVLLASTDGQQPVVLTFDNPIPPDDYRPCVVFRTEGTAVEAMVVEASSSKRQAVATASTTLTRMWEARSFCDAELTCGGRSFLAHREVLAAASPVFAATFGGCMQEASAAKVEIGDTTPGAVEALLRCIYTSRLEPGEAAAVLPLAHRYQIERLVRRCSEVLLRTLSCDTVANIVRTLRRFREDKAVAPVWDSLIAQVLADETLLRATLETPLFV